MSDFVISDPELVELLDNVRKELDAVTSVAKSEKTKEGEKLAKNIGPEGSAGPAPEESSGGPAGPGPEGPGPDEAAAGPASAEELLGQLIQAYSSMQPEELMIHYKAAKVAVVELMQGGETGMAPGMGGGPGAGSPEASPGPSMAAGPGPGPEASLGKAAMPANPNGDLTKSEGQADAIEALLKSYSEKMELMEKAIGIIVGAPQRKAVTGVDYVSRVEPEKPKLSKSEVLAKLDQKARDPDLKKSDRDAINKFALGSVNLSAVEHLLG